MCILHVTRLDGGAVSARRGPQRRASRRRHPVFGDRRRRRLKAHRRRDGRVAEAPVEALPEGVEQREDIAPLTRFVFKGAHQIGCQAAPAGVRRDAQRGDAGGRDGAPAEEGDKREEERVGQRLAPNV